LPEISHLFLHHFSSSLHSMVKFRNHIRVTFDHRSSSMLHNLCPLPPHEPESGNHSLKLYEQMMDQNHQHRILIQHLMHRLTCPAISSVPTERKSCFFLHPQKQVWWFPSYIQLPNCGSASIYKDHSMALCSIQGNHPCHYMCMNHQGIMATHSNLLLQEAYSGSSNRAHESWMKFLGQGSPSHCSRST